MASHVNQFIFLGDSGFRFPVAHYPVRETVASELMVMAWDLVQILEMNGFKVPQSQIA